MKVNRKTICILGGGQLGKMTAMAAQRLGIRVIVWAPAGDNPAMGVADIRHEAPFHDQSVFAKVCEQADVITTEFENVPVQLLVSFEEACKRVCPSSYVVATAQSRRKEKDFVRQYSQMQSTPTVGICAGHIQNPGMMLLDCLPGKLKTDSLGYDGKGQRDVSDFNDLVAALEGEKPGDAFVLEKLVPIHQEGSVLVARNATGTVVSPMVRNVHQDGILRTSSWGPHTDLFDDMHWRAAETKAMKCAEQVANALDLTGILVLEFFITTHGTVLFNEMAPRPHNSFHASIEASGVSQFEQHVRAILGFPLKPTEFHTPFTMTNIIGPEQFKSVGDTYVGGPPSNNLILHLYGKEEAREGRKMGHITKLHRDAVCVQA